MKNLLYLSFLILGVLSFGQERTVYGNVVSKEDGFPLPGATVIIDKTYWRGTQTDLDGNYSLKNVTPNDTLVFSYVGMKTQKIRADRDTINIVLQEDILEDIRRGYPHRLKSGYTPAVRGVTAKDIRNADNPKYNFKKNVKNNVFVIYVSELSSYDFSREEWEFQEKYNVKYSLSGGNSPQYFKKYNKLTFKDLNKKYKKSWQTQIRKDAIGLDEFLK